MDRRFEAEAMITRAVRWRHPLLVDHSAKARQETESRFKVDRQLSALMGQSSQASANGRWMRVQ